MAFRFIALALGLVMALGGGAAAMAQEAAPAEPTPEQILAGKRIWTDAACFNCHGTNGQGGSSKDFPHGPSLRTSVLDRATMYEVTACGLPGTLMPAWAKGAYTERGCFGDEPGEVPEGTRVIGAYDEAQMQSLMDYIYATFRKGKE